MFVCCGKNFYVVAKFLCCGKNLRIVAKFVCCVKMGDFARKDKMRNINIDKNDELPKCTHEGAHEVIRLDMPTADDLYDLAELFKIFGDSTRVRILYALFDRRLCVCELAQALEMTMSAISHQLRVLKQADLVRFERVGKTVYYFLADDHVRSILGCGMEHIMED